MSNNAENRSMTNSTGSERVPTKKKQENALLSLLLNVVAPVVILKKADSWAGVSPSIVLMIALAFPVAYFFYDLKTRGKYNAISVLGFVSVLLTGGIGLLELPRTWLIIKEGSIPLLLGCAVLFSLKTRYPLVRTFLYNDAIIQTQKIDTILKEKGKTAEFDRLLLFCTWLIASSFFFSAIAQYILASVIVTVDPAENKELFNQQVGDMTWISYLVILVPSFIIMGVALWRLFDGIKKLTGLELNDVFIIEESKK